MGSCVGLHTGMGGDEESGVAKRWGGIDFCRIRNTARKGGHGTEMVTVGACVIGYNREGLQWT